ncbi:hypothetical protein ASE21_21385 [Flavobacterium sp. Root901]|uniref:hypothetical protein n=1 Tax=Flavobacterium sp. Root901 TaxID=1736605 RepID=UPI00070A0ACA|nr:hypothetical protein [Flavobacterium sp. Root901]KRD12115.1 hypothetical protein ASE21_21385 [Flavobacterium sp. Root901]
MSQTFWIETNWGTSIDNVGKKEILSVLNELSLTQNPSAAFWVVDKEGLNVLQIHKNLCLHYIYGENLDRKLSIKLQKTEDCLYFIDQLIEGNFFVSQGNLDRMDFFQ